MDSKTIIIILLAGGAALGVYWYISKKKKEDGKDSLPGLPVPQPTAPGRAGALTGK